MGRTENDLVTDSNDAITLLNFIEEVTSKCEEEQDKVLAEILSQNAEVEYLKRHGCPKDKETFKSKVPIVSYEDLKPDILRIANGDTSPILCAHRVTEFFRSSGTSGGVQKLIPTTAESMVKRHLLYSLPLPVISKSIEGLDKGKSLFFLISKDQSTTPGGLLTHAVSTAYFRTHYFMDSAQDTYTSPIESIHCFDHFQSMYTQLLCGFYQRHDVVRVGASFAATLVTVVHFLKDHYSEICQDITSGLLSPKITDPGLRAQITDSFMGRPNTELAEFINSACNGENWEGIIPKIWPNTKYLEARVTGSMAQYISALEYYSSGLPLVSHRYASAECACGVNLNPICKPYDEATFTLIPNMAYFEFMPLDSSGIESDSQPVALADVEIGTEYELLVTTSTGLYRYRVEDVLCPTGFYNSTPQFKFVRRKNVVLGIDADKTTESELLKAIESVSMILKPFNTMVLEYTSYAHIKIIPGHYVIYLELFAKDPKIKLSEEVLGQCCLAMENSLSTRYRRGRVIYKSIGPLEIRVVKNGFFEKLREYAISRGTSLSQYKVPRCLKLLPMVQLMDSGVISTHFSPSFPIWGSSDV
ncbi:indole-3-acetic acid-amido synthetase GH3.4-like [Silene latifolia]|uniref:indole-3-acetic acid-amido synthetase GH3.4-like n=1 Tax=Silene latifolia TaxID=37657 RepID=UPI003D786826